MSDSAERNHERIEWGDLMKGIAIYCMGTLHNIV